MRRSRSGHIKLDRKLFQDPFWTERRPYSRFEAWVDLIQRAQFADRVFETEKYGRVELKRGEVVVSVRKLMQRWNRSQAWVHRFLTSLRKSIRISIQRSIRAGTVYLIVNYDAYQSGSLGSETHIDTPSETHIATSTRQLKQVIQKGGAAAPEPSPTAPEPSSLDILPKSVVDSALANWARIGGVNYVRFRNVLLDCVTTGIPADDLPGAVEAYAEWYSTLDEREQQFAATPEKFGQQAARFAKLGKLPIRDEHDDLTARGAILYRGIPA